LLKIGTRYKAFINQEVVLLIGRARNAVAHRTDDAQTFLVSANHDKEKYWMAFATSFGFRGFVKDETYSIVKITQKVLGTLKITFFHDVTRILEYNEMVDEAMVSASKSSAVADEILIECCEICIKKFATKKVGVPPFVVSDMLPRRYSTNILSLKLK
jgi:ATP-dependent DNA helicase RecQ